MRRATLTVSLLVVSCLGPLGLRAAVHDDRPTEAIREQELRTRVAAFLGDEKFQAMLRRCVEGVSESVKNDEGVVREPDGDWPDISADLVVTPPKTANVGREYSFSVVTHTHIGTSAHLKYAILHILCLDSGQRTKTRKKEVYSTMSVSAEAAYIHTDDGTEETTKGIGGRPMSPGKVRVLVLVAAYPLKVPAGVSVEPLLLDAAEAEVNVEVAFPPNSGQISELALIRRPAAGHSGH
jgi:hypothetical protein